MNYVIFDLEFNQGYKSIRENINLINTKCPFEIIQIGAVKLDDELKEVSSLNSFIKPYIYEEINPYVHKITGITLDMLKNAKPFEQVYKEFIELSQDSVLCVWGLSDMKELFRNIKYYDFEVSSIPKEYINLQHYASKYLSCPKGMDIGLEKASELLSIALNYKFHDAYNDALYTAEIFKKIFDESIKPAEYSFQNYRIRQRSVNKKVDYNKLMEQFEKMYHRELTQEEKSMIKLAYLMGKTNQFPLLE